MKSGRLKSNESFINRLAFDEETFSEAEEGVTRRLSFKERCYYIEGVRIFPAMIEFIDAFEGKRFKKKIVIQNIGRLPAQVKIGEPSSFAFQMNKSVKRPIFLAPGSCIRRTISYSYHSTHMVMTSRIPVQINSHTYEYPIIVKHAKPVIEVSPNKLEFKVLNIAASAKTLTFTIFNKGGKRTRFLIDTGKDDLNLVVTPTQGIVKAKSNVKVCVEMMGLSEGEYYKELWITSMDKPIRLPITAEVVRPRLEVVQPIGTEAFTLIHFGPTVSGTQTTRTFVLKNCSAESTFFVVVVEVDGNMQVMKEARKINETIQMFKLSAEEGRLEPFESRILTVLYETFLTH